MVKSAVVSLIKGVIKLEEKRLKDGKYDGYEAAVSAILEKAKKVVGDDEAG